MIPATELIKIERERQLTEEFHLPENDDMHTDGEMSVAAVAYATATQMLLRGPSVSVDYVQTHIGFFNWPKGWQPPKVSEDHVRNLVKAAALLAAEADRLQRENMRLNHPFDHPCTFGEDEEILVIRADIAPSEALERLQKFYLEQNDRELNATVANLQLRFACAAFIDDTEDWGWRLYPAGKIPKNCVGYIGVLCVDTEALV